MLKKTTQSLISSQSTIRTLETEYEILNSDNE